MRAVGWAVLLGVSVGGVGCNPPSSDGLGPSTKPPQGVVFEFPEGVSIAGQINQAACEPVETHGTGTFVDVCIVFDNLGDERTLDLPSALVFVSALENVQNGLLLQGAHVVLPDRDQKAVRLNLYCLNEGRDGSGPGDLFDLGPITNDPDLLEVTSLVAGKDLSGREQDLQQVIWNATERGGLTTEDRELLHQL